MAKPEWGTKRICPSCGTRYYDLMREQVICPRCSTPFDAEAFLKARRSRPVAPIEKEVAPAGAEELDTEVETDDIEEVEDDDDDGAVAIEDGDDEEDEELMEDASELGEDEDDMAEVIDNVEEEES